MVLPCLQHFSMVHCSLVCEHGYHLLLSSLLAHLKSDLLESEPFLALGVLLDEDGGLLDDLADWSLLLGRLSSCGVLLDLGVSGFVVVLEGFTPLGLLVLVHDVLLVHRLRTPRWLVCCHQHGGRPSDCRQDQDRTGDDRDQLVHIPNCVLVPHARCQRRTSSCLHPDGLLRVRHHLQVRCRLGDLPDLLRQIPEGGPLGMKKLTWPFSFFLFAFSYGTTVMMAVPLFRSELDRIFNREKQQDVRGYHCSDCGGMPLALFFKNPV